MLGMYHFDTDYNKVKRRVPTETGYQWVTKTLASPTACYIPVVVPTKYVVHHIGRKGITTQNVMDVCDFDMMFTFVLAGWPGSVHDMRVFKDAREKFGHVFPEPPPGIVPIVTMFYGM